MWGRDEGQDLSRSPDQWEWCMTVSHEDCSLRTQWSCHGRTLLLSPFSQPCLERSSPLNHRPIHAGQRGTDMAHFSEVFSAPTHTGGEVMSQMVDLGQGLGSVQWKSWVWSSEFWVCTLSLLVCAMSVVDLKLKVLGLFNVSLGSEVQVLGLCNVSLV